MMQELADKEWANSRFRALSGRLRRAWIAREIGAETAEAPDLPDVAKLVEAAAILACSNNAHHRLAAYRVATSSYELHGCDTLPLDRAVRVVLARLGNFPAFGTRQRVADAQPMLPLGLLAEELASSDRRTVDLHGASVVLTNFRHDLWTRLKQGGRVAVAAPTSAGKSFVL